MSRMHDKLSAPATATKREVIAGSPRDALLTFNTFKIGESTPLAGRQIVVSADRSPTDLENLDDHLRSRLLGSVVVEMKSPDESLRFEIFKSQLDLPRTLYPGFDVAEEDS